MIVQPKEVSAVMMFMLKRPITSLAEFLLAHECRLQHQRSYRRKQPVGYGSFDNRNWLFVEPAHRVKRDGVCSYHACISYHRRRMARTLAAVGMPAKHVTNDITSVAK